MMARTQVSMSKEEQKRAKRRADELGISFAEYIRRLVRQDLGTSESGADISVIFGLGDSGGSNISRFKDEYVGEAAEAEWGSETGRSPE